MNSDNIFRKSKEVWENNLKKFPQTFLNHPDENLVRILSGRYVDIPKPPARLMDHGFGHGNTLLYASQKGYECYGCEISDLLISEVNKLFINYGVEIDLRAINNLSVPYNDNMFEIVISWNVIHYTGTRANVIETIKELYRVLKPNGVLILSTIHPENAVFRRTEHIGENSYHIKEEANYDNRKGLTFYVEKDENSLKELFSSFSEVKIGKSYFNLFNKEREYAGYLVYAKK